MGREVPVQVDTGHRHVWRASVAPLRSSLFCPAASHRDVCHFLSSSFFFCRCLASAALIVCSDQRVPTAWSRGDPRMAEDRDLPLFLWARRGGTRSRYQGQAGEAPWRRGTLQVGRGAGITDTPLPASSAQQSLADQYCAIGRAESFTSSRGVPQSGGERACWTGGNRCDLTTAAGPRVCCVAGLAVLGF